MIAGPFLVRIVQRIAASAPARYNALNRAISVGKTRFPFTVFLPRLAGLAMGLVVQISRRTASGS